MQMNANREQAESGRDCVRREMQRMGIGIEVVIDRMKRIERMGREE